VILISGRRVRLVTVAIGVTGLVLAAAASPALAQDISVNFGNGTNNGLTERVIQMIAMLTVLSLAPSILVMMTSSCRWRCSSPPS
jgi:flagellar biosynthetic protein FliP